jgi:hypothetical protein
MVESFRCRAVLSEANFRRTKIQYDTHSTRYVLIVQLESILSSVESVQSFLHGYLVGVVYDSVMIDALPPRCECCMFP